MISSQNMQYINIAIKAFNPLVGKTYLIAFSSSSKKPLDFIEVQINEKNFWHLTGCRFDEELNLPAEAKDELYKACLNGSDISDYLRYTDAPNDVKVKCNVLQNIFNFIDNAKILLITDAEGTPEQYMFSTGIGTNQGLVGYIENKHIYIPKTAQDKSINIKKNVNNKIRIILSRSSTGREYGTIEYEAAKDLFTKLLPQIKDKYNISKSLSDLISSE